MSLAKNLVVDDLLREGLNLIKIHILPPVDGGENAGAKVSRDLSEAVQKIVTAARIAGYLTLDPNVEVDHDRVDAGHHYAGPTPNDTDCLEDHMSAEEIGGYRS